MNRKGLGRKCSCNILIQNCNPDTLRHKCYPNILLEKLRKTQKICKVTRSQVQDSNPGAFEYEAGPFGRPRPCESVSGSVTDANIFTERYRSFGANVEDHVTGVLPGSGR
jgi:hypothetical protein